MLAVLSFNGADEVVFSACRLATLRLFRSDKSQRIFASVAPIPNEIPTQRRNSNLASQKWRTLITESKSICGSDNKSPAQNTPRAIALTKSVRRSVALRVSGFDLCISLALVWKISFGNQIGATRIVPSIRGTPPKGRTASQTPSRSEARKGLFDAIGHDLVWKKHVSL